MSITLSKGKFRRGAASSKLRNRCCPSRSSERANTSGWAILPFRLWDAAINIRSSRMGCKQAKASRDERRSDWGEIEIFLAKRVIAVEIICSPP